MPRSTTLRSTRFRNADDFDAHVSARRSVCRLDLFPDTPEPDPAIGRAAESNAQIAQEMQGLAREQWDYGKGLTERYAPVYERLLNSNIAQAETANARGNAQWADYDQLFRPIERRFADEAMTYDSPQEMARREGLAAGTVQAQADSARAQNARAMAAMGVSPDSGRSVQSGIDEANTLALAKAGAVNQERNNTKLQGMAMRQSAAQFGRNQTSTSIAQNAAALQGNQAASNTMGQQTAQSGAALQGAGSLYSGAVGANNSSANIGMNLYGQQVQNANNKADSMGSMLGLGLGTALQAGWISDENAKEDIAPVDDEAALSAIRQTPVKEWDYKPGVGDEGHHVGAMAQDLNANLGPQVAPGGTQVDPISYIGELHAGLRALDKKVDALAGKKKAKAKPAKGSDFSTHSMQPLPI